MLKFTLIKFTLSTRKLRKICVPIVSALQNPNKTVQTGALTYLMLFLNVFIPALNCSLLKLLEFEAHLMVLLS